MGLAEILGLKKNKSKMTEMDAYLAYQMSLDKDERTDSFEATQKYLEHRADTTLEAFTEVGKRVQLLKEKKQKEDRRHNAVLCMAGNCQVGKK